MSFYKYIPQYIKQNFYELIITFCIFTNLFPSFFPAIIYYLGLGMIIYKMVRINIYTNKNKNLFITLIFLLLFSSIINIALNLRLILFCVIIFISCPIYTSYKWYLYKRKLINNFFIGFVCVVVISIYAKLTGYNNQTLYMDKSYLEAVSVHEFSGFAVYPMWISAAAALSSIYLTYLLFKNESEKRIVKIFYIILIICSIYINIISASRSALSISLGIMLLVLYWCTNQILSRTKYIAILGIITISTLPFFAESATRIKQKQEYQKITGKTSRDVLWKERLTEFTSSPLWGIGFASHGIGVKKKIGRNESGGGWISILAQTGIAGIIIILLIWKKAILSTKYLRNQKSIIPVYGFFVFFSLHSIFEGYIFQGGWYLCIIFWMIIGTLIEYKDYEVKYKRKAVYHGKYYHINRHSRL